MTRPVLQRGDQGPDVINLQHLLGMKRIAEIGKGLFGPVTEHAVCEFQKKHKLPTTGVVDAATWAALHERSP